MSSTTDGQVRPSSFRLELPADPALALAARTFVSACARVLGLDEERCEDLRLAANEVFAAAVEQQAGEVAIEIQHDGSMTVKGIGDLDRGPADVPVTRADLLRALFPGIRLDGSAVVIAAGFDPAEGVSR